MMLYLFYSTHLDSSGCIIKWRLGIIVAYEFFYSGVWRNLLMNCFCFLMMVISLLIENMLILAVTQYQGMSHSNLLSNGCHQPMIGNCWSQLQLYLPINDGHQLTDRKHAYPSCNTAPRNDSLKFLPDGCHQLMIGNCWSQLQLYLLLNDGHQLADKKYAYPAAYTAPRNISLKFVAWWLSSTYDRELLIPVTIVSAA